MSTDHSSLSMRHSATMDVDRVRSGLVKSLIFAGCLAISAILLAGPASAHVKWFVDCNVSDDPLPLRAVFTPTFFMFTALFLSVFYLGCKAEQSAPGAMVSGILDWATACLHARSDELLRASTAVSFALLWADGGLILTPELKGSSIWLSAIQLLIPLYLFWRATLPAAGMGILMLYGFGAVTFGLFHMMDYPVFLGLGTYFALSVSSNPKLFGLRYDVLRWTVAFSLLWPAMEKFVYPAWLTPIALTHPELTLGLDVALVVTAAGVVEFGLAFALYWTPLVRRLAALVLILLLTAATFDFGKVDGVGHMMIIIILLVVVADPGSKPSRCRPALAPVVGGAALLATLLMYTGAHTLDFGSARAAILPLVTGVALLAFIVVCLTGFQSRRPRGRPSTLSRMPSGRPSALSRMMADFPRPPDMTAGFADRRSSAIADAMRRSYPRVRSDANVERSAAMS